jgi:uncharacterized protein GlcG (DUF336 family)
MTPVLNTLSFTDAQRIMDAALRKAEEIGQPMNVWVVDAYAYPLAFCRQEGAKLGSIDIGLRKARTAALQASDTAELGRRAQPGGPLYGIEVTNGGLVLFGGGVRVMDKDGAVVGAIGVSAGTVDEDESVALAGAEAYAA